MVKIVKDWKRPPVVEVKWRDAAGKVPAESRMEWTPVAEAAVWEPATCYSVGYLISNDEVGVRLAQDIGFNTNEPPEAGECNGLGVIPAACVEWVKVIRK